MGSEINLRHFVHRYRFHYGELPPPMVTKEQQVDLIWKRIQALRWMKQQRTVKCRE